MEYRIKATSSYGSLFWACVIGTIDTIFQTNDINCAFQQLIERKKIAPSYIKYEVVEYNG